MPRGRGAAALGIPLCPRAPVQVPSVCLSPPPCSVPGLLRGLLPSISPVGGTGRSLGEGRRQQREQLYPSAGQVSAPCPSLHPSLPSQGSCTGRAPYGSQPPSHTFVNSSWIKLPSQFPIWVCHLLPGGPWLIQHPTGDSQSIRKQHLFRP